MISKLKSIEHSISYNHDNLKAPIVIQRYDSDSLDVVKVFPSPFSTSFD